MATSSTSSTITIARIDTETIHIPIVGTSPLLIHKFSEKAKRQMLDAMQGRKNPKTAKDPEKEFTDAAYRFDDGGYGFPVIGFKAATVSASRLFDKSVTMTMLRQALFFNAEWSALENKALVRIIGEPIMREDVVRIGINGADLRYRPQFTEWSTSFDVTYVKSMLDRNSVLSIIDAGGMGVGVGEWRPEKNGDFGTYMIDPSKKVEVKSV